MPDPDIATIADIVRVHAARRPDAAALVVGDRTITFAELDARSSRAAQAFRAAGIGFGDRVAYIEKALLGRLHVSGPSSEITVFRSLRSSFTS